MKKTSALLRRFYSSRVPRPVVERVANAAKSFMGDRCSLGESVRTLHGTDLTYHTPAFPDIVCFPQSTEEVSKLVTLCNENNLPVIPYGAGTSLEGHFLATNGGMTLNMNQMNKIIDYHSQDLDITVESGVTREQVNEYIREQGLFFPIDPGANASIGGMASTRASGTNAVRYGTMRENILNLRAVMPNGQIIKTARRAKKSSSGYDLTRLLIGAEGTLGVITEITLKLYGIPEAMSAAICNFPNVTLAAQTVSTLIQCGVPVARVELLDETCVKAVNKYSKLSLKEGTTLFFEFHGSNASVEEQAMTAQGIAAEFEGADFIWETEQEKRTALWKARHAAYWASLNLRPGSKALTTDVCVPISRLADCITETKQDFDSTGLLYTLVGHVGDGNFHLIVLLDENNPTEMQKVKDANHRLIHRAISMDGTCTGEHGIGIGKIPYMLYEHGPEMIKTCLAIKKAIDPNNIMNPGKMYPTEQEILNFKKE